MNFKILFITAVCFFGLNTKEAVAQTVGKTPGGFEYIKTVEGIGKASQLYDYVFFTLKIIGNDGTIFTDATKDTNMPYIHINHEIEPNVDVKAVTDLLKTSRIGDAYKVIIPLDSLPMVSQEIKHLKHIEYLFTVKNIRTQEEYDAYISEMQKEMEAKGEAGKVRAKQVETLVKTTLEDYKADKLELKTTDSGLKYYIVEPGSGDNAADGDMVTVNYYGSLEDGTRFDDSFSRGQEFSFKVGKGQVIKGWDEGFTYLKRGSKAFLFISSDLGYGDMGGPPAIPENTPLVFYLEVENIQKN